MQIFFGSVYARWITYVLFSNRQSQNWKFCINKLRDIQASRELRIYVLGKWLRLFAFENLEVQVLQIGMFAYLNIWEFGYSNFRKEDLCTWKSKYSRFRIFGNLIFVTSIWINFNRCRFNTFGSEISLKFEQSKVCWEVKNLSIPVTETPRKF